jgi:hypothetical protein
MGIEPAFHKAGDPGIARPRPDKAGVRLGEGAPTPH